MNSVDQAFNTIKQKLDTGEWTYGERMPSLAKLAQRFSVSRTTMWRVVGKLQKSFMVHARRRGAIIAGPAGTPSLHQPAGSLLTWERLAARIGQDIHAGVFTRDYLPPLAKLSLTYDTSINTLKKALEFLIQERLIKHTGVRYHLATNKIRRYMQTLLFIADGNDIGEISFVNPRTEQLAENFERECHRLGCSPQLEGFNQLSAQNYLRITDVVKNIDSLSGCIVSLWRSPDDASRERWLSLFSFILSQKIPLVVIDQEGDLAFPDTLLRSARLKLLRIAGKKAGESVAASLLQHGHRHIAYVTPFYTAGWMQKRYEGLCDYYKRYAGPQADVNLFTMHEAHDLTSLTIAHLGLDKSGLRALYGGRYTKKELSDLEKVIDSKKSPDSSPVNDNNPLAATIHSVAGNLINISHQQHEANAFETMLTALHHIASNSAASSYLQPLFKRVLEHGHADVWVCAEEKTALLALKFLREHGHKVPDQVSVIGFDNFREVCERQLTTFDFNMHGIIQGAIHLIMDEKTWSQAPVIQEVDGYVVERRTTRR